jgi:hypothetical protein
MSLLVKQVDLTGLQNVGMPAGRGLRIGSGAAHRIAPVQRDSLWRFALGSGAERIA